jgi:PleD family two-component response regulator
MSNEVDDAVQKILRARERPELASPAVPIPGSDMEPSMRPLPVVLLVMEDLFFRKLVRRQLEEAGYGVHEAISVRRALTRLAEEAPDLVLLDTWVDRGSGLTLLEALRSDTDHQHIPVLLVGNETRGEVRARAEQLGALGPVPINRTVGVELWVDAALHGPSPSY